MPIAMTNNTIRCSPVYNWMQASLKLSVSELTLPCETKQKINVKDDDDDDDGNDDDDNDGISRLLCAVWPLAAASARFVDITIKN